MELTDKHREYWRKNLTLTVILLAIWAFVTFILGFYRPRPAVQLLRLAVRILGGRAGGARRVRADHLVLRDVHEQARPAVRRARGGRLSHGHPNARPVQGDAEEGVQPVHRRLHRVPHPARDRRADGPDAAVDRVHLPARDRRSVRGHRRREPHRGHRRVLRGRTARARVLQRHGDRRRLDERRVVHRYGRHALSHRVLRPVLHHGLDRRLLPGGVPPRTVLAEVRAVHDP